MSNEKALVRKLEQSMSIKSLSDLVRVKGTGEVGLAIDVSGSMGAQMRNRKTRIQALREVVKNLQEKKIYRMIAFGLNAAPSHDPTGLEKALGIDSRSTEMDHFNGGVAFVDSVPEAQGGTPLAEAIDFARTNGFGRLVVISDGAPNFPHEKVFESAKAFGGQIDVVYVGDPGDAGSFFLDRLAQATGGKRLEGDLSELKEITSAIAGLLAGDVADIDEDEDLDDDDDDDEDDDDDDDEDDDTEL